MHIDMCIYIYIYTYINRQKNWMQCEPFLAWPSISNLRRWLYLQWPNAWSAVGVWQKNWTCFVIGAEQQKHMWAKQGDFGRFWRILVEPKGKSHVFLNFEMKIFWATCFSRWMAFSVAQLRDEWWKIQKILKKGRQKKRYGRESAFFLNWELF